MEQDNDFVTTAHELLEIEAHGGVTPRWTFEDYLSELESSSSQSFYFHDENSIIKGFVLYRPVDEEAWITQWAVRNKGQGEGGRLLTFFVNLLKEQGFKRVGLEVAARNEMACRIYKNLGFRRIGERKNYYKDGDTAWTYVIEF